MTTDGTLTPSGNELEQLRREVELLRAQRDQLLASQAQSDRTIEGLQHQLQQLLRRMYGRSAEKIDPKQMALFEKLLEQLAQSQTIASEPATTPFAPALPVAPKPAGHGRRRLPCDLPRQKVIHDLPEQEKPCPCCGKLRHVIGQEISEQLDYVPAKLTVAACAEAIQPLYNIMVQEVLASRVLHTDDTPVDVLDRKTPGTTKTGRFWVYAGDEDHPQVVFDYTPSRSRDGPMEFLKGWGKANRVYLQADAFGGYDGIYRGEAGGQVTEVACWSHARRKLYDARTADAATSTQALAYIRLLYDVEDQAKALAAAESDPEARRRKLVTERLRLRRELSTGRLVQFKAWLESRQAARGGPVLPKSPMGQAIAYALNQWDALCVYTTDGELAIDNNVSERALRRIAIGRGNWTFLGSDNGGRTAAILFSIIATCERHDINPFTYLRDVLTRIAEHPMNRLAELLPQNWQSAPAPTPA